MSLRFGIVVVGLAFASACIQVVPFDDPRWAGRGRLGTLAVQSGGSMSLNVEAVLNDVDADCEAVSRDAVVVIDEAEHELLESDYRAFDCEFPSCGGCGGARNGRPINVGNREGDVATGYRDADGAIFVTAANTLVLRSMTRETADPIAAGSQLDLIWSPFTDVHGLVDIEASLDGVAERWAVAALEPGSIVVDVPRTATPGQWRVTGSFNADGTVTECDVAECSYRIVTDALFVDVDVVAPE